MGARAERRRVIAIDNGLEEKWRAKGRSVDCQLDRDLVESHDRQRVWKGTTAEFVGTMSGVVRGVRRRHRPTGCF
jgi:hypothetical protein